MGGSALARRNAGTARGKAHARKELDTEAGIPSGITRRCSIRSRSYWFTEFCNSQCLSHFAAPFIVVRAETSVAESCNSVESSPPARAPRNERCERGMGTRFVMSVKKPGGRKRTGANAPRQPHHPRGPDRGPPARRASTLARKASQREIHNGMVGFKFV